VSPVKPTDILFLPISGPNGASSRYRVYQFLPSIAEAGIEHAVHLPLDAPRSGIGRLLASLREREEIRSRAIESRAIFVQKRLLPQSLIDKLAERHLAFDFDDAIFTSPRGDRSFWTQRRTEARLRHTLGAAELVLVGNRYLYEYAAQYTRNLVHLPTVVDLSRYPAKTHAVGEEIVIGWIGHSVNHPYLAGLEQTLLKLSVNRRLRLLVVSDRDISMPGLVVENRRWSEAGEVADILDMDVGIMPMPDDPWSRGKCGLKAIQYMAAGVPVVCAAVGANLEIVRNGIDGYCATTEAEWLEGLDVLCGNASLRQEMGQAARQRVGEAYCLESAIPVMLKAVTMLCR
jgi:glycosyltransferase involved in cell wall biosynthesis